MLTETTILITYGKYIDFNSNKILTLKMFTHGSVFKILVSHSTLFEFSTGNYSTNLIIRSKTNSQNKFNCKNEIPIHLAISEFVNEVKKFERQSFCFPSVPWLALIEFIARMRTSTQCAKIYPKCTLHTHMFYVTIDQKLTDLTISNLLLPLF